MDNKEEKNKATSRSGKNILASIIAISITTLIFFVFIGVVYKLLYLDENNIDTVDQPLETLTSNGEIEPFSFVLFNSESRSSDNAITLSGEKPANCILNTAGNKWFKNANISCDTYKLFFEEFDEAGVNEYASHTSIETSALGQVLRVRFESEYNDNNFHYVSQDVSFQETGKCNHLGFEYEPPCGSNAVTTDDAILLITCLADNDSGVLGCDEILKSIELNSPE